MTDARARLHAPPTRELSSVAADLDGDGQEDTILYMAGDREPDHLLYLGGSCARFVARIVGVEVGCSSSHRTHGMCDLYVETWLMHGDRKSTTWVFDGTSYAEVPGSAREILGPRPPGGP